MRSDSFLLYERVPITLIESTRSKQVVYICTNQIVIMARQSISFTEPNDEWLKAQVEGKEYSSKSELVNDLVRQARKQQQQIDLIRIKLEKAEKSGFTTATKDQILEQAKSIPNG